MRHFFNKKREPRQQVSLSISSGSQVQGRSSVSPLTRRTIFSAASRASYLIGCRTAVIGCAPMMMPSIVRRRSISTKSRSEFSFACVQQIIIL